MSSYTIRLMRHNPFHTFSILKAVRSAWLGPLKLIEFSRNMTDYSECVGTGCMVPQGAYYLFNDLKHLLARTRRKVNLGLGFDMARTWLSRFNLTGYTGPYYRLSLRIGLSERSSDIPFILSNFRKQKARQQLGIPNFILAILRQD